MPSTKTTLKTSASTTRKSPSTSRKKYSPSIKSSTGAITFKSPSNFSTEVESDESLEDDVPKGAESYEERYIAFVDILGFKDLIRQSQKHPEKVQSLWSALDTIRTTSQTVVLEELGVEAEEVDLRVHTFSDFVVASVLPTSAGLSALAYVLWNLSTSWLSMKILCRGGITKGLCVHTIATNVPMVFGPAFVDAYELESSVADLPRIILSKETRNDWQKYVSDQRIGKYLPLLIHQCDDGPWCIDIFCHLRRPGFDMVKKDWPTEASQMHATLVERLDETAEKPAVYRKALWLTKRFNHAITMTQYGQLHISVNTAP